ncbi:MAG TPA: hypothetical protein VI564_06990 [Candidatus Nanoarchaeia archaeon]|nr:hypothetical protein [Candidatus Nanoarchaeia archaeon]
MIPLNVSLSYYKREDIQKALVEEAKDLEIGIRFNESFGKRPDVLLHNADVFELAKQGATSFHSSEERWRNPLQLDPSLKRHELDGLRIGWDLILDIDCGIFEYSREAADLVVKALKFHKIKSVSCKFSGNKGFHIGVPFEAFPEKVRSEATSKMFPEAPKRIAAYIKEMIKKPLGERIEKLDDFNTVLEKTGKNSAEITYYDDKNQRRLNAEPFLEIDTILLASRHLYRMCYSLHEKSGLASVPVDPDKVLEFRKEFALPNKVTVSKFRFLDSSNSEKEEAQRLFREAYDFTTKNESLVDEKSIWGKELEIPTEALPEELFPPCIKLILNGIEDGKKRALFILINYFSSIGWSYEMIEEKLKKWNEKNREPIKEVYLLGQLRYHKQMQKKVLPPNCQNEMYMVGIGVCKPDNFCPRIKNPAQYTTRKAFLINNDKKGRKVKKS